MEINREHAMITGLDHVVVLLDDIKAGAAAYELLLARAPAWRSHNDGAETVMFTLDNMTLELMAPASSGPTADRIRSVLKIWGEGLASICFRVSDVAKMHRRLDRLALKPDAIADVESRDADSGKTLNWKRSRAATEATRGVRMFFLELAADRPLSPVTAAAPKAGIDVSEVRAGRKPRTRIVSVRSGTCGIHTLLVEATPRESASQ
jgi:hypothetical protein